jgi:hypothetical protein
MSHCQRDDDLGRCTAYLLLLTKGAATCQYPYHDSSVGDDAVDVQIHRYQGPGT